MEGKQLCLIHWTPMLYVMHKNFCEMLEKRQCIDIHIYSETKVYGAHVLILLTRSPYFKESLAPGMKKIIWKDIPAVIIKDIIRFMYYGNTIPSEENMLMFLRVANFLGLECLDELKALHPECEDISTIPIPTFGF